MSPLVLSAATLLILSPRSEAAAPASDRHINGRPPPDRLRAGKVRLTYLSIRPGSQIATRSTRLWSLADFLLLAKQRSVVSFPSTPRPSPVSSTSLAISNSPPNKQNSKPPRSG